MLGIIGEVLAIVLFFMFIRLLMEAANFIGSKFEFSRLIKEVINYFSKIFVKHAK